MNETVERFVKQMMEICTTKFENLDPPQIQVWCNQCNDEEMNIASAYRIFRGLGNDLVDSDIEVDLQ